MPFMWGQCLKLSQLSIRAQQPGNTRPILFLRWKEPHRKGALNMLSALLTYKAVENAIAIGLAGGLIIVAAGFVVKSAVFLLNLTRITIIRLRIAWLQRCIRQLRRK